MVFHCKLWKAVRTVYEANLPWPGWGKRTIWTGKLLTSEKTWCGCPNRWLSKLQHWRYMERLQQHSMWGCLITLNIIESFTLAQKISLKNHPSKDFWMVGESLPEHWGSGFSYHPPLLLSGQTDFICETWHSLNQCPCWEIFPCQAMLISSTTFMQWHITQNPKGLLCTQGWGVITWATWSCPFEGDDDGDDDDDDDDVDMENERGWTNRFGWQIPLHATVEHWQLRLTQIYSKHVWVWSQKDTTVNFGFLLGLNSHLLHKKAQTASTVYKVNEETAAWFASRNVGIGSNVRRGTKQRKFRTSIGYRKKRRDT